jgi:1-acyl-sn-glycerol-3-phosphate acyltransferase
MARKSPVRFAAGLVFTAVYWPSAVICLIVLSVGSGLVMKPAARRRFGQDSLGFSLGSFITGLKRLGVIRVDDADLAKLAAIPGPIIIACNHPALWDAPLMLRRIGRVSCIMKADVEANPLLRNGARFAGFIPNSPRLAMIREAVSRLEEGGRLLLFPEGTRTLRGRGVINRFRPGLALLAKKSGAPVLPVFISTNSPYLGKGWPIWKLTELPVSVSFRVGETMTILPEERVRDFSERLEERFRVGLGEFRTRFHDDFEDGESSV